MKLRRLARPSVIPLLAFVALLAIVSSSILLFTYNVNDSETETGFLRKQGKQEKLTHLDGEMGIGMKSSNYNHFKYNYNGGYDNLKYFSMDYITNKKYVRMCDVAYKTRSKNNFKLPLYPDSIVCANGDNATLREFFQLPIDVPFTLVTIESDDAIPHDERWLKHKYLKKWYSWNSKHPSVIPIPIGLNENSQLGPMQQAKRSAVQIEKILVNFRQDTELRKSLFEKVKNLPYVHVKKYSRKWDKMKSLTMHYEEISKFKWTLCPRGAGEDTHRLWESLYLGSIPIVVKSSLSPLYTGLPIIQLESWDQLSLDVLREREKTLPKSISNAFFTHWSHLIRGNECEIKNCVLSYSLYGANPRYIDGALANAKLYKIVYPWWKMRVYYDKSVPQKIVKRLLAEGVDMRNVVHLKLNKMSWRFLAASDSDRACYRDIDSRLSQREKAAVDEWVKSQKKYHIMRDHPSHTLFPMSGGMWCSQNIPDMPQLLAKISNQKYLEDMNFLNRVIWPRAQKSLLQHDSFSCDKFGETKPFPTKRVGWEHTGSVFLNGTMRKGDVDILKQAPTTRCGNSLVRMISKFVLSPFFIVVSLVLLFFRCQMVLPTVIKKRSKSFLRRV